MQQRYKRPRNQPRRNEQWAHLSSGKCSRLSHISIHADNFATCLKQRCLSCLFAAPPIPSLHPILPDPRLTSLLRRLSPPTLTLHLCLFHPLFSLQVTVTTTGRGWGEDIKWSLTSKLVRLTQRTVMTWLWLTSTYAHWARKALLPFNQMNPPQFPHLERSPSNQTVLFVKTH